MRLEHENRGSLVTRGVAFVAVTVLVAACSSGGASSSPAGAPSQAASGTDGASVSTKLSEFKIELGATTAAGGPVTFALTNAGTTVHEFVVFKTDLAPDKLPLAADGTEVDEEGAGLTLVDEVEDIAVGATASLPVDLATGHYVLICNLPAHYTSGMHAEFTTN
jgi:uncharacterized cupredoxin-like copper-binding protein